MTRAIKRGGTTHEGKGYGFVTFGSESDANRLEEIIKSSDRVAVIVGLARLDELLIKVLSECLCGTEKEQRNTLSSSFKHKLELAYLTGLISKEVLQVLETLAEIRNLFAHNSDYRTFEDLVAQDKTRGKLSKLHNHANKLGSFGELPNEWNEAKITKALYLSLYNSLEVELYAAIQFAESHKRSRLGSTHSTFVINRIRTK